jgi:hypothetical protein
VLGIDDVDATDAGAAEAAADDRTGAVCSGSCANVVTKLMTMPLVPVESTKAGMSWQSMVIDLVSVTWAKPPGSRHLISPLMLVLSCAP